jgi:DNA polymerase III subunit delta'
VAKKPAKSDGDDKPTKPKAAAKTKSKAGSGGAADDLSLAAAARATPRDSLPPAIPGPLADILGHDRALDTLRVVLRSGRVHHAWIFQGPVGVGKFTAALAFAAVLLDPSAQPTFSGDIEPDPDSPTQQLLRAGTHPDLHVVVKELAKFSDDRQIRERKLIQFPKEVIDEHVIRPAAMSASMRSGALATKVFIIDEAELLNGASQNALLKTLEEPPPGTVLILVTSSEERLLPTIRSRSQRVAFSPLPDAAMRQWAKKSPRAASDSLTTEHFGWLIEFADGSPGTFLAARDGGLFEWHQKLAPKLVAALDGQHDIELGPLMAELCETWAKATAEASANASKEAANKAAAEWMFRLVAGVIRRELRTAAGTKRETFAARCADALDLLREAESQSDSNVGSLFVMERFSAELAALAEAVTPR